MGKILEERGGYFELDLPMHSAIYPEAFGYQSARAAIRAAFEAFRASHVFLPAYICSSIFKSAIDAKLDITTYHLDNELYPESIPTTLPANSLFVYVNYFGLCDGNIERLLTALPGDQLIIDNSQALFSLPNPQVLATIYSPRKFAGLPDGGLLYAGSKLPLLPPQEEDKESINRMRHLLTRLAYPASEGYNDFNQARDSLRDNRPQAMSALTYRLMQSLDWEKIQTCRSHNYQLLATALGSMNHIQWFTEQGCAPLCYPFMHKEKNIPAIRQALIDKKIYTPIYWPDVTPRMQVNAIETSLLSQTLFLPLDQRLQQEDIIDMIKTLQTLME